ncbi:MAG TPA: hypothetical protein VKA21_06860 [Candidatus Binatia bacterium]|nr:hypothetical protein [Candidatus Binatia bacterium]
MLPRALGDTDEGLYLYEATRVVDGARLYRDVYHIQAPGFHWLMAALFEIFGSSIATARIAAAVIDGLIVVLVYRGSRLLGARPALATVAALMHVAVDQPAWPYASPHWLGALIALAAAVWVLRHPCPRPPHAVALGALLGAMIGVQHQKAPALAAGAFVVLVVQHALDCPRPWGTLVVRLLSVGAGIALVLVPLAVVVAVTSGVEPTLEALVYHLRYYRAVNRIGWGAVGFWNKIDAANTFPALLAWGPIVVGGLATLRLVTAALRPGGLARERGLFTATTFLAFGVVSIVYRPDFIHIAFIGPVVWMLAAETVEGLCTHLRPAPLGRVVGGAVAAVAVLAMTIHLARNRTRIRATFPVSHATPFGEVAFRKQPLVDFVERTRTRLAAAGTNELFVYPGYTALYLLTGTRNPTRFQQAGPNYSPPAHLDEILAVLERRRLPYLIVIPALVSKDDPVVRWMLERYEPDEPDFTVGPLLLARKAGPQ